ncbi:MAG: ribokinase, partial [bacterium]
AKTGGTVRVVGAVGTDEYGEQTIENFQQYDIDTEGLFQIEGEGTGLASIMVDESGENQIGVAPRANLELTIDDVEHLDPEWYELDYFAGVLELQPDLLTYLFRRAHEAGNAWTVLNAAPAGEVPEQFWQYVDCLIVNESEAGFYTGTVPTLDEYQPVAEELLGLGVERVILTLGEKGGVVYDRDRNVHVPAPETDTVDTTGAGDAFIGRYLSARSQSLAPRDALQEAVEYASETVRSPGTQKSYHEL